MCKYKNLTQKQCIFVCSLSLHTITFCSLVLLSPLSVHDFSCLSPPRSLFLSTIPESADLKMVKFIDKRLKASDLNESEASQLVVVGLNHVSVTPEIINIAKVRNWWTRQRFRACWRALVSALQNWCNFNVCHCLPCRSGWKCHVAQTHFCGSLWFFPSVLWSANTLSSRKVALNPK